MQSRGVTGGATFATRGGVDKHAFVLGCTEQSALYADDRVFQRLHDSLSFTGDDAKAARSKDGIFRTTFLRYPDITGYTTHAQRVGRVGVRNPQFPVTQHDRG